MPRPVNHLFCPLLAKTCYWDLVPHAATRGITLDKPASSISCKSLAVRLRMFAFLLCMPKGEWTFFIWEYGSFPKTWCCCRKLQTCRGVATFPAFAHRVFLQISFCMCVALAMSGLPQRDSSNQHSTCSDIAQNNQLWLPYSHHLQL